MTHTSNTIGWLNQNRNRAYPLKAEEWREKFGPVSPLDCVLLDALVFDADASSVDSCAFVVKRIAVQEGKTEVDFMYRNTPLAITIEGGEVSGERSYEAIRGAVDVSGRRNVTFSMSFSSHAYILDRVGVGEWDIECPLLESRVVHIDNGFGVDGIHTRGSYCVDGHTDESTASGDVVLEDGFRTRPVIRNGKVVVLVGRRFGKDTCGYECYENGAIDCRKPLFFFCGQNAVNSGDVVIRGGKGISVRQGGSYTINDETSKCNGKTIPCIEIIAGGELLDIYSPTVNDGTM